MKRSIAVLLAAVACCSLVACEKDPPTTTPELPTNTVNEAQMLAAFEDAKDNQVSKQITFSLEGNSMIYTVSGGNYSYVMENVSEYLFVVDGFMIYTRTYDEDAGEWGTWQGQSSQSQSSFYQSYNYMHKPNLFLEYYAPASFADISQAADGGYEYTISGNDDYDSYKVYFVGGKLTKFVVYNNGDEMTLVYEYGDYTVEIPQV